MVNSSSEYWDVFRALSGQAAESIGAGSGSDETRGPGKKSETSSGERTRFATELHNYVNEALSASAMPFQKASHGEIIVLLLAKCDTEKVTSLVIPELFHILEDQQLKKAAPLA